MTTTTALPQPDAARPRRRLSTPVTAVLAALLGLWLGLTAPSVSPVAPPPPAVVAVVPPPAVPGLGAGP